MRLAVLADIHGNLPALEAVVADIASRRVDAVVNLGDCVSGPLWPAETLAFLQGTGWPTVRGNHDRRVASETAATLGRTDRDARATLDPAGRRWLDQLPSRIDLRDGLVAFHARPGADDAYLLEDQHGESLILATSETIAQRLSGIDARLVLTAHSHQPRVVKLPMGCWIVNPGSVGCPAYDDDATDPAHISETGSPAARYAVIETQADDPMVEFLSIPYAHATAAARAAACGRPDWAHALSTGYAYRADAAA